ncbi:MAG: HDOD domain-containing protein [Deltaproteobacteria bacterium]|nr:HDOD domain-containing protein [Deltaproteobacteria bacterium]
MQVVLVDDEPLILRGMQRVLRQGVAGVVIRSFESGEQALTALGELACDVIITDMRMPAMDGAALLERVHALHPGTVRIVLTGDCDDRTVLRVTPHMHQFLAKPCPPEMLSDTVKRASAMRALLRNDKLWKALGGISRLPSLPAIYLELQTTLADPRASSATIAHVVERDAALTTKMLQIGNSSYFGAVRAVVSVEEAVRRVGVRLLQGLALSLAVFEAARKELLPSWVDLDAMQARALKRLELVRRLGHDHDDIMLAALLADVGVLALAASAPEAAAQIGLRVRAGMALVDAETEIVGVTHAEVGAYLLGLWGLPLAVVEGVAWQLRPGDTVAYDKTPILRLHVATQVAAEQPLDEDTLAAAGLLDKARAIEAELREER